MGELPKERRSESPWRGPCLAGGGVLLTAFAGRLPEHVQDVGLGIGLLLCAVGVLDIAIHWARERRAFVSLFQTISRPSGTKVERIAVPDIPPIAEHETQPAPAATEERQQENNYVMPSDDGRIFVEGSVTPGYLVKLYKPPNTTLRGEVLALPFIGKWIVVEGPFGDLKRGRAVFDGKLVDDVMTVTFSYDAKKWAKTGIFDGIVVMYFDPHQWFDRLSIIAPNDYIIVLGKIDDIKGFGITLSNCELVRREADGVIKSLPASTLPVPAQPDSPPET